MHVYYHSAANRAIIRPKTAELFKFCSELNMAGADALIAALAMIEHPQAARLSSSSHLPKDVSFVLEIAAGEDEALGRATQRTGRSEAILQKAAAFFIEQVLLRSGGDSYRVLGCDKAAPAAELRRNMALLMRWLHPDVASNGSRGNRLNRSLFANRITQAWESIKTEERRAAYDASLSAKESELKAAMSAGTTHVGNPSRLHAVRASRPRSIKRLVIKRVELESFWSRLRQLLGGL